MKITKVETVVVTMPMIIGGTVMHVVNVHNAGNLVQA